MGPGVLSEILKTLPSFQDERLLVGFDGSDDACVYKLRDDLAVIQTVDFFTPVVDDPYQFGQIAAANALSDIYAMGAQPTLALNLLCLPDALPLSVAQQILAGGYSKVKEAGAVIAGGHTISDPEPKYGLCVSGFAHPLAVWSNAGAKKGDLLILTKPLGSGVMTTAAKRDLLEQGQLDEAVAVMAALNKGARDAAAKGTVHACTDVTGFGMLGHLCEMAESSGVTAEISAGALPILSGAAALAEAGVLPGGAHRNMAYVQDKVDFDKAVPQHLRDILCDPQTSGGLLLSVPEAEAGALLARLEKVTTWARVVGRVLEKGARPVRVRE